MTRRIWITLLLAFPLAASITPLFAHHSSAPYDVANVVTLKGTVTGLDWRNPHVRIHLNVPDANGKILNWDVETWGTGQMSLRGITNGFLKPGDPVSLDVFVAKDGGLRALVHMLTLPDGRKVDGPPIDIR
jgi:WD40 repeat protein